MEILGLAFAVAFAYVAKLYLPSVDRAIAAYEKTHTPPPSPKTLVVEPLPFHVSEIVDRYTDDVARASVAARARELHEDCADWGQVAHLLEQEIAS